MVRCRPGVLIVEHRLGFVLANAGVDRSNVDPDAGAASRQSATLVTRADLLRHWRALGRRHPGDDVPRPPAWQGYRLTPRAIEFWTRGEFRLHHRERFERVGARNSARRRLTWTRRLLQP